MLFISIIAASMCCDMWRAREHDSVHGQLPFECLVSSNRDTCDLESIISQSTYRVLRLELCFLHASNLDICFSLWADCTTAPRLMHVLGSHADAKMIPACCIITGAPHSSSPQMRQHCPTVKLSAVRLQGLQFKVTFLL